MPYPGALDNLPQRVVDGSGLYRPVLADINDPRTAISNIEATLGINPQGVAATVAARLAAIEAAIPAGGGGGGGGVKAFIDARVDGADIITATAGATAWQKIYDFPAVYASPAYFLGTVELTCYLDVGEQLGLTALKLDDGQHLQAAAAPMWRFANFSQNGYGRLICPVCFDIGWVGAGGTPGYIWACGTDQSSGNKVSVTIKRLASNVGGGGIMPLYVKGLVI